MKLANVRENKRRGMEDIVTEMPTYSWSCRLLVCMSLEWDLMNCCKDLPWRSKWVLQRLISTTVLPSIPPPQKSWLPSSRQTDRQTSLGHTYIVVVVETLAVVFMHSELLWETNVLEVPAIGLVLFGDGAALSPPIIFHFPLMIFKTKCWCRYVL